MYPQPALGGLFVPSFSSSKGLSSSRNLRAKKHGWERPTLLFTVANNCHLLDPTSIWFRESFQSILLLPTPAEIADAHSSSTNIILPSGCWPPTTLSLDSWLTPLSTPFGSLPWLSALLLSPSVDTEFTPQLDWTALGTFCSIMLTALWLFQRTNAVEQAVVEREQALAHLRRWKSQQLVNLNTDTNSDRETMAAQVQVALEQYEQAVQQEETLRNLVPGGWIRIVPPNAAGQTSDKTAKEVAKLFLGKDYDIGSGDDELENDLTYNRRPTATTPNGQLPITTMGVLAILGVSLMALLIVLSLDPATISAILNDL